METTTRTPERRIDSKIRRMQIGGALCAMFAAVGITAGIREMSPEIGWIVPILAGLCAAAGFAIIWHAMIGTIVGMIRLTMIVALFVVAAIVTTASWGISAHSIATALAGRSAMSAELSAQVDTFNQTMAKAYAEATGWKGIAGSAAAKAAGFRLQADTEAGGSNGNGKGCGPICASYRDEAGSFTNSKAELGLLKEADDDRDQGEVAMSDLRSAAARSDQEAFIAAADHVDQSIEKLNAIDPTPIIRTTGAVHTSSKGIDLTKETAEFRADTDKALANRKTVAAPTFTPMAIADATRRQVLGAAMHGLSISVEN